MIELKRKRLVFRFPDVHEHARCAIGFQRTLRIPDDNRDYPLPPGLGNFPIRHVDDYRDKVPAHWNRHGGVLLPMHQSEAMWISFQGNYPMAVKVAAGKIDALTGKAWSNDLSAEPQNYLVVPEQPWLDGFSISPGLIRQFVAMPLGAGYSAEEQLTGEAQHGGLQIMVYPMKASAYEAMQAARLSSRMERYLGAKYFRAPEAPAELEMGLAPGGLMRQEIYEDEYGLAAWDLTVRSRCFVHILNSVQFFAVTGMEPPDLPPTAMDYTEAGLPWFTYYGGDRKALAGAMELASLDSIAAVQLKQGEGTLADNEAVQPTNIVNLSGDRVREGDF